MAERIRILNATRYNFTSPEGQKLKGCKLTYQNGLYSPEESDRAKGVQLFTVSAPYEVYDALPSTFPCEVEATFNYKQVGKNLTIRIESVRVLQQTSKAS
jgi:hypothetical protein